MTVKTYFLGIFIAEPQQIHAGIKPTLQQLSGGEYEFVHLHKTGIFAVLNTEKSAAEIEKSIGDSVTNDDRRIILEVSGDWQTFGLNKAAYWLQNHLDRQG